MRADCSETSFHDSPVEQRLQACEMLGSRENVTNEFSSCLYTTSFAVLRDDFLLDNLASGNLEATIIRHGES